MGEAATLIHGTTILAVKKGEKVVMACDGQVTLGETVMKHRANKLRFLYQDQVLAGFAGASADAFALFEKLEGRLEQFSGNLVRASVELAKDWRLDKYLRRLEAMLLAVDRDHMLILSGTGDLVEPDQSAAAIGSGGPYAYAAALALLEHSTLDAPAIAGEAMKIAASICLYTNDFISVEEIGGSAS